MLSFYSGNCFICYQKLFNLMQSYLSMLVLISSPTRVLFRKPLPVPLSWSAFLMFSYRKVSGFILRSSIHFELLLYRVRDRDLVSVLYVWISSFPSTICWRGCLFSNICIWHTCWESGGCSYMGLFLGPVFSAIDLHVCCCVSTMLFLYYCSIE
jgi:hypothetical protein